MSILLVFISVLMSFDASASDHVQHQYLNRLTEAEFKNLMKKTSKILIKADEFRSEAGGQCTSAGWVFKKKLNCTDQNFRNTCKQTSIKCAAWTGSEACVKNNGKALIACLQKTKSKKIGSAFLSPYMSDDWLRITRFIKSFCFKKKQKICRDYSRTVKLLNKKIKNRSQLKFDIKRKSKSALWGIFFNKAYAARICSYSEEGEYFIKRNGERIYLHFASHQAPGQGGMGFVRQFLDQVPEPTKEQVENFLSSTLQHNRELLRRFDSDRDRVKALYEEGHIKWSAMEILPDDFNRTYIDSWQISNQEIRERIIAKGISPELYNRIFSYAFGPILDEVLTKNTEDWNPSIPLVGFDSSYLKSFPDPFVTANEIGATISVSFEDANKLRSLSDQIQMGTVILTDNQILSIANQMPASERQKIVMFLKHIKNGREMSKLRDSFAAQALLSKEGSGIVLMGEAHKVNLIAELKKQCVSSTEALDSDEGGLNRAIE